MKVVIYSALVKLILFSLSSKGVSDAIAIADILSFKVFRSSPVAKGTLVLRSRLIKGSAECLKTP